MAQGRRNVLKVEELNSAYGRIRVLRLRAEGGTLLDRDKDEHGAGNHRHPR